MIGNTPLVRLRHVTAGISATGLAKVEYFNPGGSVKDRIALRMVDEAGKAGPLQPGGAIVEPTSGETGVGVAPVAQCRGDRGAVAGVGTGGTISGVGRYLKEVSGGRVRIVGADPEGSVYSGGSGRPYLVEGVGEDFWPQTYDRAVCDEIVEVSDKESFELTRRLAREEGLLVGGSCGMAAVAALRVAAVAGPEALVVVLLPDGGRGYLSKIFNDEWMARYGFLTTAERSATVADVLASKSGRMPEL